MSIYNICFHGEIKNLFRYPLNWSYVHGPNDDRAIEVGMYLYFTGQSPSAKTALDFDLAVSSATSPAGSQTSEDSVVSALAEEIGY